MFLAENAEEKGDAKMHPLAATSLRLFFPLRSLRETDSAASPQGLAMR
jgi:hypothetical protein